MLLSDDRCEGRRTVFSGTDDEILHNPAKVGIFAGIVKQNRQNLIYADVCRRIPAPSSGDLLHSAPRCPAANLSLSASCRGLVCDAAFRPVPVSLSAVHLRPEEEAAGRTK